MTLDIPSTINLLWRREVVVLSVDKVSGLEVGDSHFDREGRVGFDGAEVGGELELG